MKYNLIGASIRVSEIGFGGIPILSGGLDIMPRHYNLSTSDAIQLLKDSFDYGINFYDTAINTEYGDSELKIGKAFSSFRDKVIISSKARAYSSEEMEAAIVSSLKDLDTDYIDLYGIHQLSPSNYAISLDPELGAIRALREAKKKGLIRSITVGTHFANTAAQCSNIDDIDMVQIPYNPIEWGMFSSAMEEGLKKEKVVFHKIFGAGALPAFLPINDLIAFALQPGPVSVFVGIGTSFQLAQLKEAYSVMSTAPNTIGLPHAECNRCQKCTCHEGLNISLILRYRLYALLGFHRWAATGFFDNYTKQCTRCGQCKDTCPRGIDIPRLLAETELFFQQLRNYKEKTK